MIKPKLRHAYCVQKIYAKKRGILFLLTFEEWLNIWIISGHLHERGNKKHQYVMARHGDKGPYALDNVKIITWIENRKEQKFTDKTRAKFRSRMIGNTYGLGHISSEKTKAKMSIAMKGNKFSFGHKNRLGFKASEETKQKCSTSAKERWDLLRETGPIKGHTPTIETRQKMRISAKNRKPMSAETRAKMQLSQQKRRTQEHDKN